MSKDLIFTILIPFFPMQGYMRKWLAVQFPKSLFYLQQNDKVYNHKPSLQNILAVHKCVGAYVCVCYVCMYVCMYKCAFESQGVGMCYKQMTTPKKKKEETKTENIDWAIAK